MTNKILIETLKLAGFKNADGLARVISATPNPTISLELTLGIYEPKAIMTRFRMSNYATSKEVIEFTSYDEVLDKVEFKICEQNKKQVWYLTEYDFKNDISVDVRPNSYFEYKYIPTTGFTERKRTLTVSEFENSYPTEIDMEHAVDMINSWDEYGVTIHEDLF